MKRFLVVQQSQILLKSPSANRATAATCGADRRNFRCFSCGTTLALTRAVTSDIKRQLKRMLGEFLREVGVLVVVFAPLEWLVTYERLTLWVMAAIVVVVPSLALGMYLGLER